MTPLLDTLLSHSSGPAPLGPAVVAVGPPFDALLLDASTPPASAEATGSTAPGSTPHGALTSQEGAEAPDASLERATEAPERGTSDAPVLLVAGPLAAPSQRRTDQPPTLRSPALADAEAPPEAASSPRPATGTTSDSSAAPPVPPSSEAALASKPADPDVPEAHRRAASSGDPTALDRPVSPLQSPSDPRLAPRGVTETPHAVFAPQDRPDVAVDADAPSASPAPLAPSDELAVASQPSSPSSAPSTAAGERTPEPVRSVAPSTGEDTSALGDVSSRAQPTVKSVEDSPVDDLAVRSDGEPAVAPKGRPTAYDGPRSSQTAAPRAETPRAQALRVDPPATDVRPTPSAAPVTPEADSGFAPLGSAPSGIALAALAARSVPLRTERLSVSAPSAEPADLASPVRWTQRPIQLDGPVGDTPRPEPPSVPAAPDAPLAASSPIQMPPAVATGFTDGLGDHEGEPALAEGVPGVETLEAAAPLHAAPDARAADSARPAPPPLPARLATSVWLEHLTANGDRVQVSLGEDGSVRLRTQRQADGVTVHLQFSDPEMQALAGVHADRLREALETHFAEPVRLALADARSDGAGPNDAGSHGSGAHDADGQSGGSRGTRPSDPAPGASGPDDSPLTSARTAADGRREWVG